MHAKQKNAKRMKDAKDKKIVGGEAYGVIQKFR